MDSVPLMQDIGCPSCYLAPTLLPYRTSCDEQKVFIHTLWTRTEQDMSRFYDLVVPKLNMVIVGVLPLIERKSRPQDLLEPQRIPKKRTAWY
ncbi:hypothetical protein chiPu_0010795 [Chiloscyllium punctatum]|uniref:Uncharacterized protein n=1 Tax=Chiloscyllium punctatum TaxID=137246 RepID=A0A401SPK7_CHIPU|nr:hypothetical protein [Chiloscyllium punctatum]